MMKLQIWAALALALPALGQGTTTVMKLDTGTTQLDCKAQGLDGMPILNFNLTASTTSSLSGGLPSVGRSAFGGLKVTRVLDECSPGNLGLTLGSVLLKRVILTILDSTRHETMRVTVSNVFFVDLTYTPGQEGLTLLANKVEVFHPATNHRSCWDFEAAKAC